jgi:hypothetical protein
VNDFRNTVPRFSEAARKANQSLIGALGRNPEKKSVTTAQSPRRPLVYPRGIRCAE